MGGKVNDSLQGRSACSPHLKTWSVEGYLDRVQISLALGGVGYENLGFAIVLFAIRVSDHMSPLHPAHSLLHDFLGLLTDGIDHAVPLWLGRRCLTVVVHIEQRTDFLMLHLLKKKNGNRTANVWG